mmetsp:Transcript_41711/g.88890  ORF Transcript_41711/g.88890 Transcript_41711/m.88890 type:complete len:330 (+) Transcript_41711:73-1062(+)
MRLPVHLLIFLNPELLRVGRCAAGVAEAAGIPDEEREASDRQVHTLGSSGVLRLRPGAAVPPGPLGLNGPLPPPQAFGLLPAGVAPKRALPIFAAPAEVAPLMGIKQLSVAPATVAATRRGIHDQVVRALALSSTKCHMTAADARCNQVKELLEALAEASNGVGAEQALDRVRAMLDLKLWLHSPGGPAQRFALLDSDGDGMISLAEAAELGGDVHIFMVQDSNKDNAISKEEVFHYLSAAVSARELVPDVDDGNPGASKQECLDLAAQVLKEAQTPPAQKDHIADRTTSRFYFIGGFVLLSLAVVAFLVICSRPREWFRRPQDLPEAK